MARTQSIQRSRVARRELTIKLRAETPCTDCGVQYPYYIMEFDHVRGVKVANVTLLANNSSWKNLRAEIAKCEIVCANCHAARTHIRRVAAYGTDATGIGGTSR